MAAPITSTFIRCRPGPQEQGPAGKIRGRTPWRHHPQALPGRRNRRPHGTDYGTQRLYDPGKGGQSRKKLIRTDGEVQAMYLLFREHHLLPSAVMKLGYGERQVMYAFIRYEMEERNKKVSSALSD